MSRMVDGQGRGARPLLGWLIGLAVGWLLLFLWQRYPFGYWPLGFAVLLVVAVTLARRRAQQPALHHALLHEAIESESRLIRPTPAPDRQPLIDNWGTKTGGWSGQRTRNVAGGLAMLAAGAGLAAYSLSRLGEPHSLLQLGMVVAIAGVIVIWLSAQGWFGHEVGPRAGCDLGRELARGPARAQWHDWEGEGECRVHERGVDFTGRMYYAWFYVPRNLQVAREFRMRLPFGAITGCLPAPPRVQLDYAVPDPKNDISRVVLTLVDAGAVATLVSALHGAQVGGLPQAGGMAGWAWWPRDE